MIKPPTGPLGTHTIYPQDADPVPGWRNQLDTSSPEGLVKLLVEVAAWAQRHPKSPEAWTLLGDTYLHLKQPYAAEKAFLAALGSAPKHASAREGLGLALMAIGRTTDALKHLGIAHQLAPDNADILVHWGMALVRINNLKAAHNRFRLAIERDGQHSQAWLNMGLVDVQRGAWKEAIGHFQKAVIHKPNFAEALNNLTLAFRHLGELDQALATATTLTEHHPGVASHWILLAELRLNAGQLDLVESALQQAKVIDPGAAGIYIVQSMLFAARRQHGDAEGVLKTALVLSNDDPNIQLDMGHLHLLLKRYGSGWDLHEARKLVSQSPVRRFPFPDWQGEDVVEKSVLVHAEQGLGDTIMFANCLPDLIARADRVVIETSTRLARLFARSFPTANVVGRDPKGADMNWLDQITPPVSYQIPIGSLPRHFRRSHDQFPSHAGYLRADPERVAYWRHLLSKNGRPTVGLTWRGGLLQTGREQRTLPLMRHAASLGALPVQWVCLQHEEFVSREVAEAATFGLNMLHWPDVLNDQDEVAALTCALDRVVTVCNTQAHLTGALGVPGWVLTPFSPNWRYGADGEVMPWYPSLRLLRQTALDDWSAPLAALQFELADSLKRSPNSVLSHADPAS